MKSFVAYIAISVGIFMFSTCGFQTGSHRLEDQIFVRFPAPNFGGDWTHFEAVSINKMELTLDDSIYLNAEADRITLVADIEYSDGTGVPHLPGFDTKNSIVFRPSQEYPVLRYAATNFSNTKKPGNDFSVTADIGQKLRIGTVNDITLSYNMNTTAVVDFNVTIQNGAAIVTSDVDELYNFDVNYIHVKESTKPIPESINIVVMADGYRLDEMRYFRDYVNDAFDPAGFKNFHYTEQKYYTRLHDHIENDFFMKWKDSINVFAFETVSPHSGIDTDTWVVNNFLNNIKNFFDIHRGNQLSGKRERMRKIIDVNSYKTGLSRKDVDVYVIFVNDPTVWAYSFAYSVRVDDPRNKQPVTFVVIQAPAGHEVDNANFHSIVNGSVKTDAIAHELGHAMAQLLDEYMVDPGFTDIYLGNFRNISVGGGTSRYKWHGLIDVDRDYFNDSPKPIPRNDNKLVENKHAIYSIIAGGKVKFYIPTVNSTMRGDRPADDSAINCQFGPVNTYFMEGSFMVRIGELNPQNPLLDIYGFELGPYQWSGYSFVDFHEKWGPDKFIK